MLVCAIVRGWWFRCFQLLRKRFSSATLPRGDRRKFRECGFDQLDERARKKRLWNRGDHVLEFLRDREHFWDVPRHHDHRQTRCRFIGQQTPADFIARDVRQTVIEQD